MTAFWITVAGLALFAAVIVVAAELLEAGDAQIEAALKACLDDRTPTEAESDDYWANWPAYFADWDRADDQAEDDLDRQLREGLNGWGGDAA